MKICFDVRQEIERLKNLGKSLQEIAVAAGIGMTSVRSEYKRCGGKASYTAIGAQKHAEDIYIRRSNRLTKPFTPEEISIIHKLMEAKANQCDMKRELKCSWRKIYLYLKDNFPEYRGGRLYHLENEIDCIKQQLEIVIDLIKDLKR